MLNSIPGVRIHFRSSFNADMSPEESETVHPGELIAAGQPLLTLESEKESPGITLEAGENTVLSTDGREILSSCYGYPRLTVTKPDENRSICASLIPLVEVSADWMEARLNLFPPVQQLDIPDIEIVLSALKQKGVVYGMDHHALETILVKLKKDHHPQLGCLVARGKIPSDGKDACIRFEVEIGPLPGKLLPDGSIDFRERLMFAGVKKDQLLACKVPATRGYPGRNLAGEQLEAVDGSDITVKVSENTLYCENDGTIRATASGVLSMVGDNTIRVFSKLKMSGDVNFHTGNIRSNNCIEISGTVHPGFLVAAKGDLYIGGGIQSALVNSLGNAVIKGGIIGRQSKIRVQGDADIQNIEKGLIAAGGNIVVRVGAYYSSLQAGGNIHCPENAKIVGGNVVAGGSLICGQIGSPTAEPANIAVGTDPSRYRRYQTLQQEYHEALQETQGWYIRHGNVRQASQSVLELEAKLRAIEKELSTLNLIPGTPEDSLGDRMFSHTQASVTVHKGITDGNSVRIGNDIIEVEHDLHSCTIRIEAKSGQIIIDPL